MGRPLLIGEKLDEESYRYFVNTVILADASSLVKSIERTRLA